MTWRAAVAIVVALGLAGTLAQAGTLLPGSRWQPVEMEATAVPADTGMFIGFGEDGRIEGHGGCNGFFGSYEVMGETLEIGPLGATRMACPEAIMDRELRFFEVLSRVHRYRRDGADLVLEDAAGTPVLRLAVSDAR